MTPDEYTNQEFYLDVGEGHRVYVLDWGNAEAKTPIIFLHGGPGAGCNDSHKQNFDPSKHRVIFFDQRGSGKSVPFGEIGANKTEDLIKDIEKIRHHLELASVYLCGRSWGSTLALVYAIHHPHAVKALYIGGIYLATPEANQAELENAKMFFPELTEEFLSTAPAQKRADAVDYHLRNILGKDTDTAKRSAYAYSRFNLGFMRLDDRSRPTDYESFQWENFKVDAHYKLHKCFLPDNFILKNASKLTMPVYIVQGRYDVGCPPKYAYELHQTLPNSQLIWTLAGHSNSDRANYDASRILLSQIGEA